MTEVRNGKAVFRGVSGFAYDLGDGRADEAGGGGTGIGCQRQDGSSGLYCEPQADP